MALRGDPVKSETYFRPEKDGNKYASNLVSQIQDLNEGLYLDDELLNTSKTDFCIGVAAYPEKHMEAPSMESDMHFLKKKINKGAEYIVTQMFFDNAHFFKFTSMCKEAGIDVPIVPGLKPVTKLYQVNSIPRIFHVNFPDDLMKELKKVKTSKAAKEVGIEWCIQQSKELKAAGVPCIHYYTMGDSRTIQRIARGVF